MPSTAMLVVINVPDSSSSIRRPAMSAMMHDTSVENTSTAPTIIVGVLGSEENPASLNI